jgi:hypothetical protein
LNPCHMILYCKNFLQLYNSIEQFKIWYKYTQKREYVTILRSGLWRIQRTKFGGWTPPPHLKFRILRMNPLKKIQIHFGTPFEKPNLINGRNTISKIHGSSVPLKFQHLWKNKTCLHLLLPIGLS